MRSPGNSGGSDSIVAGNADVLQPPSAEVRASGALGRFVDSSTRPKAMFDAGMRYVAASARWCAALLVERTDVLGQTCYDVQPQFSGRWRDVHQRCLKGHSESGECQVRLPADDRFAWIRWEARPWYADAGEVAGLVMRFDDISSDKEAQLALASREQQFEITLDAAHAGSWLADTRTRCLTWDRRARAIYGVGAETDVTTIEALQAFVAPEDRDRMRLVSEHARTAINGQTWSDEFRIVRPDGAVRWVLCLGQTQRDDAGTPVRIAGIVLDVTSHKKTEEALAQAHLNLRAHAGELERRTVQLQQVASALMLAEQRTRERLSSLLHDRVQQFLFSAVLHVRRAAASESPHAALRDAERDITDALEETHSLSVDLQPVTLRRGNLPEAVAWLGAWLHEKFGITVDDAIDANANPTSDEVRYLVFEAARELLFNVVKHARVDHVFMTLELDASDHVRLTVRDAGVGFDPATLASRPGVDDGLGLFGMRERLALFGGQLEVETARGQGARLTISVSRVPLSTSGLAATELDPRATEMSRALPPDGPRPLRILLVDGHEPVRTALRHVLDQHAALLVVGEAADGIGAVTLARTLAPDVVLMDVSMPRMDGVEATRRIRACVPRSHIVGFAEETESASAQAMKEAGAHTYLVKDATLAERIVETLLRLHADEVR